MKFNRRIIIEPVVLLLIFSGVMLLGVAAAGRAPFHPDEAHKIAETYYFYLLFVKHDPVHADWTRDFYARTNPPAAKYLMGAWLHLRGLPVRDLSLQRQFERLWRDGAELRRCVPGPLLRSARTVTLFFGVLTLLMVYLIGRLSGSAGAGILGALLLACNPSFRYHATIALYDTILIFFMTAVVPATLLVLKHTLSVPTISPARLSGRYQDCLTSARTGRFCFPDCFWHPGREAKRYCAAARGPWRALRTIP
jgi:hypothetical protein